MDIFKEKMRNLAEDCIKTFPDYYLVDYNLVYGKRHHIRVFIDKDDGITLADCEAFSKKLKSGISEQGLLSEEDYILEVSSPGIDRPLTTEREFRKNIDRRLNLLLNNGLRITGILKDMRDSNILMEDDTGMTVSTPVAEVKTAKVEVSFKR